MSEQEQGNTPPKVTPVTPGAPRPITVRLKPLTPPVAADPAAALAAPVVPAAPDAAADPGSTVKLTPVVLTPVTPPSPVTPPAPVAPPPLSSPSSTSPIPAPTTAQVQAAKSKTSRISLDSAIGVSTSIPIKPVEPAAPKTIRLKRPSDLSAPMSPVAPATPPTVKSGTAPIRQTSRIPDSVIPPDTSLDSTVTQKKTLKIRRPGMDTPAEPSADAALDGVQMTPITDFGTVPEPPKGFTVVAIVLASVAAIVLVALGLCLASDALGPASGQMVADIPWPGKF